MSVSATQSTGPCGPARLEVDTSCAEAERLSQASLAHHQRLRDARHELQQIANQRESDGRLRDRRQLSQAKDAARVAYHQQMVTAPDPAAVQEAARTWLRELDRLNRQVESADRRAEELTRRAAELGQALPGIELAADAARIAAEAAQESCLGARRALAACEEEAQRRSTPRPGSDALAAGVGVAGAAAGHQGDAAPSDPGAQPGSRRGPRAITLVLRGDREALLRLAARLADETGVEAGRLQLLLLELREAIAAEALDRRALRMPAEHPFWSQFPTDVRSRVVESLSAMGYRFDGTDGWVDDRVPTLRELALAVSHTGADPRTLRRPPNQQAIDELWLGTTVLVEEYLARAAPALELERVIASLGARAAPMSELWDIWGRLRPLLLAVPSP